MEVLWRSGRPISCEEVVQVLAEPRQWREATVKTLLNRLLRKGAIKATRDSRRYLYSAVFKRQRCLSAETQRLLDRLFGGRLAPLVAHLRQY